MDPPSKRQCRRGGGPRDWETHGRENLQIFVVRTTAVALLRHLPGHEDLLLLAQLVREAKVFPKNLAAVCAAVDALSDGEEATALLGHLRTAFLKLTIPGYEYTPPPVNVAAAAGAAGGMISVLKATPQFPGVASALIAMRAFRDTYRPPTRRPARPSSRVLKLNLDRAVFLGLDLLTQMPAGSPAACCLRQALATMVGLA